MELHCLSWPVFGNNCSKIRTFGPAHEIMVQMAYADSLRGTRGPDLVLVFINTHTLCMQAETALEIMHRCHQLNFAACQCNKYWKF